MRLNQFIAHNLPCSRRQADRLIAGGQVKINHTLATFTTPFKPKDKIFINAQLLRPKSQHFSVVVYHKPKGELVSLRDDRGRRTIFESLETRYRHFTPVGRLDFASSGLLLLSDSKLVVDALMHSQLEREYLVKIEGSVGARMLEAMQNGIEIKGLGGAHPKSKLESMHLAPMSCHIIKNHRHYSKLKLTLCEGQNREIRRFFAYFKTPVLDLKRVRFGFAHLNALPVGKTRYLNPKEYRHLHQFLEGAEHA
ncbi:pseudouridine synthase [Helicobacter bizzozeronii]|uniref:pseudouridine synthase n=1 Tax=Helicobacter bizzozeronii TaxID=56877 RepID=UPI0018F804A0|nr:pseudouridine synthase [Helicobacter bizzozeronii]